jgi:hypothetical protein
MSAGVGGSGLSARAIWEDGNSILTVGGGNNSP